jgi:flagellar basal-body rod protein FlgB
MDYSNIRLMSLMKVKMAWDSENQDVLAQNIANADTPGYRAKELKKLDFDHMAMAESHRLKMRATAPSHIDGSKMETGEFRVDKSRKTYETSPVKNSVAIEEQMAAMAKNNTDYQLVTNLYKKTAGLFKTAIGHNG